MSKKMSRSWFRSFRQRKRRAALPRVLRLETLEDRSLLAVLATTTAVQASTASAAYGQAVTFTATVTSSTTFSGGTVSFYNGGTILGTSGLSQGTATLTTTALIGGVNRVNAVYSGTADFSSSSSAVGPTATITTVAGVGQQGYSGDYGLATAAELYHPEGVAMDGAGNLFISDTYNGVIRVVWAAPPAGFPVGQIFTIAGN